MEVIERRIAQAHGTGPLFWKITPGDDYPRQLKDANRELRDCRDRSARLRKGPPQ